MPRTGKLQAAGMTGAQHSVRILMPLAFVAEGAGAAGVALNHAVELEKWGIVFSVVLDDVFQGGAHPEWLEALMLPAR